MDHVLCKTLRWGFICCVGAVCFLALRTGYSQPYGMDLKFFDPAGSASALWGVHTSREQGHLALFIGFSSNYAKDLLLIQDRNNVLIERPFHHLFSSEIAAALGLWNRFDLGVSLPIYWRQLSLKYVNNSEVVSGATGIGDLRLWAKVVLLHNEKFRGFGLSLLLELGLPTGGDEMFMRNNSVLFTPRLIADYRHQSGFIISLNLAYRLRAEAKFYDLSIGDELKLALGSEIPLFFQNLSIVGEIDMALGMLRFSQDTNRYLVADLPMELRMGLRWRHSSGFLVSLGGGIALTNGYSAPDVRVIVSLGWNHRFGSGRDAPQRSLGDAQADVQADAQKLAQSQSKPDKSADQAQQQAQASTRESASISGGSPVDAHTVHAPPASMPVPVKISDAQFDRAVEQDPDPDGDGIPSSIDKCPNEPEDFDGFQDEDGCPDGGKEQVRMVGSQLQIKDQILFQSGSAQLDDSALPILKQVASYLKVHQQIQRVRIEGHTDNRGDLEMNVDLSERRARAVMNVLLKEGIQASRLEAKGYGSTKAVADNKTAEGRRLNRRVVFEILPTNQPSQTSGGQK